MKGQKQQQALLKAMQAAFDTLEKITDTPHVWEKINSEGKEEKVSDADIIVQQCLERELSLYFPYAKIVSEEGNKDLGDSASDQCIVMDPLDGTTEYLTKSRHYGISVALLEKGKISAAIVGYPACKRILRATLGKGALNGKSIVFKQCFNPHDSGILRIAVSPREIHKLQFLHDMIPNSKLIPIGAFTPKLGACITGEVNAALYLSLRGVAHFWDYMASALIAHEAGCILTDLEGAPLLSYPGWGNVKGWIAGCSVSYGLLMSAVKNSGVNTVCQQF